ncbi:MAG: ABC transporter permease [Thermoanaerobaculales bacterium]|jgi:ABC-type Na+ efflux pump permease subunit|nr:ABC transporter permease [Thermoanaerobaculales bacterium]
MAIGALICRDLNRYRRNPGRTALLFALPLVMSGLFALVFGGGGGGDVSIRVLLWDEDDSLLTILAEGAAGRSGEAARLDVIPVGSEGPDMMENGEASALLHIPAGFTDAYLKGEPATLGVLKNPAERFLPKLVDEGIHLGAGVLSVGSRMFRPELEQIDAMRRTDGFPSDPAVAALSTGITSRLSELEGTLFPPLIGLETPEPDQHLDAEDDESSATRSVLALFLPGFAVMGVLFIAQSATRDILRDRETGLLRHLLTAPVSPVEVLLAKCLTVILVCAVGFIVLIGVGAVVGLSWGPPTPVAVLVAATSVAASGTLLLIMSLVGTERQGDALTTIVIIVWSLLGGVFMPLSQMPAFVKPLSSTTLTFWAIDACNTLILDDGSLNEIRLNLAVLFGVGTLFLLAGAGILGRRIRRGGV